MPGLGFSNSTPKLCGQRWPLGSAPLSGLLRPLAIPRQMRHDAEQALHDHQLSPVVNLMLLAADQHLEAAFVPWTGEARRLKFALPLTGTPIPRYQASAV